MGWRLQHTCNKCGRFLSIGDSGVSWHRTWSYDLSGSPELHDTRYRCSLCTDKHGIADTNCHPPENHHGRNPIPGR